VQIERAGLVLATGGAGVGEGRGKQAYNTTEPTEGSMNDDELKAYSVEELATSVTATIKNVSWSMLDVLLGQKIAREWREEIGLCDYLLSFSGDDLYAE
jgi:hypothetical protein